mmetsp:Transcript_21131/g.38360  ORF Transcript_21131/g.38360 Transcript_21131/m.38360 type:complete len:242 (-) Transcript_21131:11-736(-)
MPSTTSSSLTMVLPSLTVMTPSLPTRSMASAINSPISRSLLAEMVATWVICSLVSTLELISLRLATTLSTARVMPRRRSMGFMPAATALQPSLKMARVSTVAVVVPSPAWSFVLLATCRTSCAPMFINLSENSMLFATVTPSLVIFGGPYGCSSTALRPFGPRVTWTASASLSTPASIMPRPSVPKRRSLPAAAMRVACIERLGAARPAVCFTIERIILNSLSILEKLSSKSLSKFSLMTR